MPHHKEEVEECARAGDVPRGSASPVLPSSVHPLLRLQRAVGNRTVQRLLRAPVPGAMRIGPEDDEHEREADLAAERVMGMDVPTTASEPDLEASSGELDEEEAGDEEGGGGEGEIAPDTDTEGPGSNVTVSPVSPGPVSVTGVRRKALDLSDATVSTVGGGEPAARFIGALGGGDGLGRELPADARAYFEPRFGYSFDGVRLHSDDGAAAAARSLNARAFTIGRDIAFGAGELRTDTHDGRRLLAHELAHVVQQHADSASGPAGQVQRRVTMPARGTTTWRSVGVPELVLFLRGVFTSRTERRLARRIVEDLVASGDEFRFSHRSEFRTEVVKRVETSRRMQTSQRAVRGDKAFGYPFSSPSLYWGPRVNDAARDYWTPAVVDGYSRRRDPVKRQQIQRLPRKRRYTVYGDPAPGYSWGLTSTGRSDPFEAIDKLFRPQSAHKRTLIHCDYLVSLVHYQSFARAVGKAEFNRRLTAFGLDNIRLKWNAFAELELERVVGGATVPGIGSLQKVRPSSPADLVIGDHVYFWNHHAYGLINAKIGNAWKLENAVLIDRREGKDIFLGHGSGERTAEQMHQKLADEYNEVARTALRLIARTGSKDAGVRTRAEAELGDRFPNVKRVGTEWRVQGAFGSRSVDEPLREIRGNEVIGLKDPNDPTSMNWVRRPAESR
jgi:Domain of unknown function (DUF4157)/Protein-glutamine gamma-glutamyltransferase